MTSKKSPKVNKVMGRVSRTRRGRTIALTIPNKKAATSAAQKPSTRIIFGKRYEMIKMATILMIKRMMKNIIPPMNTYGLYPVRKPQHLCWGWWKYLQKQEHQLLIEGGVKTLPFLTGFTLIRVYQFV